MRCLGLALSLLLLLSSPTWATVNVVRFPSGTPVQVCQPSDTNTNCGGAFAGLTGVTAPLSGAGTVASPLVISTAGTWSGNAVTATSASSVTGLSVTPGQILTVTTGGTLGSAAYTASTAYDVSGASANGTTAYGWGNWASNFGTTSGTIAQGNDSRINNGQTAYGWGNPSGVYLPIAGTAADSAKLNGQAASYYYPASNPNSYTTLAAVAAVGYVTGTPWSGLYLPLGGGTLTGNLTISGHNIITDTVTGTKIGTATNQLLGFFNASPVAQQTGNVCTALQNLGLVTSCTESGTTYTASDSVTLSGSNFTLTNDSASPTASQYYGTDAGSTLGYHALPSGAVSSVSSGGGTFDPTVSPTTGSVVDSANSYVKTLLAIEAANIGGGA